MDEDIPEPPVQNELLPLPCRACNISKHRIICVQGLAVLIWCENCGNVGSLKLEDNAKVEPVKSRPMIGVA